MEKCYLCRLKIILCKKTVVILYCCLASRVVSGSVKFYLVLSSVYETSSEVAIVAELGDNLWSYFTSVKSLMTTERKFCSFSTFVASYVS